MMGLISSSLAGSKSFRWAAGCPMTAQAPMATSFFDNFLMFLSLAVCSSLEIAPSTKAMSIGPKGLCFLKVFAYRKSRCLVHSCQ